MKNIYTCSLSLFNKVPGASFTYWAPSCFYNLYDGLNIGNISEVITGMTIGNNNKYLRLWYEIDFHSIPLGYDSFEEINLRQQSWIPYSKGGKHYNWYGGYDYVVNWLEKDNFNRSKTTLKRLYLKEAITWPFISTERLTAKLLPKGFLWDVAGSPCFFNSNTNEKYVLSFLISKVSSYILDFVNPTINVQAIDIAQLPFVDSNLKTNVEYFANENISLSKKDWDSFETSWDFKKHPLI